MPSLPCGAVKAEQILDPPRIQVAYFDDWVLPPGGAYWQDTGSQDRAHTLLLPGTGLTFPAMNAGLVRDRHTCTGAHLVPRVTQLAH